MVKSRWTGEEIDFLIKKRKEGWTLRRIAEALPSRSLESVKDKWKRLRREGPGPVSEQAIRTKEESLLKVPLVEEYGQRLCFGVISDSHIGSRYLLQEALEEIPQRLVREGAQFLIFAGDLYDGVHMRKDQHLEQIDPSADGQLALAVKLFPSTGKIVYGIAGNHCASFLKIGLDNVRRFANIRKEFIFLGYYQALLPLTPKSDLLIFHPRGKLAKTRSRSLQNVIELFIPSKRTISLAIVGHWHSPFLAMKYFGVWGFLAPSFQKTTPYLASQGMKSEVGGILITVEIRDNGSLGPVSWKYFPWP